MRNETVPQRQMAAWIFLAMTAPLAQLAGGGWLTMLAAGLAGGLFAWLALKMRRPQASWLCTLQWIWVTLALSCFAPETANSWPMGDAYPVVPLAMLLLAVWAAQKGTAAASGAAATFIYIVSAGFAVVLAAGIGQTRWHALTQLPREMNPALLAVFLLPCAAAAIPGKKKQANRAITAALVFGVLCAGVVQGVLPDDAGGTAPFYEMSRSLELFGAWERFEAPVCALLTVGWFAMLELLLCAGGCLFSTVVKDSYRAGVFVTAFIAGVLMLCNVRINAAFLAVFGGICWGIFPVATQGIESEKKM